MSNRKVIAAAVGGLVVGGLAVKIWQASKTSEPRDPVERLFFRLRAVVRESHALPVLRRMTAEWLRAGRAAALLSIDAFVKQRVRYHPDPGGRHDYYAPPLETLESGVGDCDDHGVLAATLAEAAGFDTAFLHVPQHVVACVRLDGELAADLERQLGSYFLVTDGRGGRWFPFEVVAKTLPPGQLMPHTLGHVSAQRGTLEDPVPAPA